ncbi:FecCD family ABC transporter permease [Paenibacillus daejeonensis]|uniref:FecCD family ABC transporter permease n=1 Tax=Paenibacillus daejeonensis TaxID=135193 RepID=UPI0003815E64|nr:iron ABC transporter permease [Paenibacillus daejeonensis]
MKQDGKKQAVAKNTLLLIAAIAVLWILTVLSIAYGALSLPIFEVVAAFFGGGDPQSHMLVHRLRLPRTLVAILVGGGLGVAGALMQGVFRNPLASPDIMGVGGGASAAAVAFLTLTGGAFSIHWLPVAAISGAFVTAALIYILGWRGGSSPHRLILIGVGISTAMSALTTFLLISGSSFKASQVLNWLTGTVYGASWVEVYVLLPWVAVCLPLAWLTARKLNVLALGDPVASGLGDPVNRSRLFVLLISVLLAGAAVGMAGAVGFIGLMAPHIARSLVGVRYQWIIPMSALIGASLMVGADMIGRLAFMPYDLPAGIFTAAIGAPFFFYLLYRSRNFR